MTCIGQLIFLSPVCLSLFLRNFNSPISECQVNRSLKKLSLIFDQKKKKFDHVEILRVLTVFQALFSFNTIRYSARLVQRHSNILTSLMCFSSVVVPHISACACQPGPHQIPLCIQAISESKFSPMHVQVRSHKIYKCLICGSKCVSDLWPHAWF